MFCQLMNNVQPRELQRRKPASFNVVRTTEEYFIFRNILCVFKVFCLDFCWINQRCVTTVLVVRAFHSLLAKNCKMMQNYGSPEGHVQSFFLVIHFLSLIKSISSPVFMTSELVEKNSFSSEELFFYTRKELSRVDRGKNYFFLLV